MRKLIHSGLILVAALFASAPTWAFRCEGKIVSETSHDGEVLALCGEPYTVRRFTDYRIVAIQGTHQKRRHAHVEFITVPVQVEEWTYNRGPNNLMSRLHFENGELTQIDTLGYGY